MHYIFLECSCFNFLMYIDNCYIACSTYLSFAIPLYFDNSVYTENKYIHHSSIHHAYRYPLHFMQENSVYPLHGLVYVKHRASYHCSIIVFSHIVFICCLYTYLTSCKPISQANKLILLYEDKYVVFHKTKQYL